MLTYCRGQLICLKLTEPKHSTCGMFALSHPGLPQALQQPINFILEQFSPDSEPAFQLRPLLPSAAAACGPAGRPSAGSAAPPGSSARGARPAEGYSTKQKPQAVFFTLSSPMMTFLMSPLLPNSSWICSSVV